MTRESIDNSTDLLLSLPLRKTAAPDLAVGLVFGFGALYLEIWHDGDYVSDTLPVAASLVGVIIGLSLASMAIIAAFMDLEYLRLAQSAGIDPVVPLRTPTWSVWLGVIAALLLLVRGALPDSAPALVLVAAGTLASLFVGWAIASVPAGITTLISAIRLRSRAALQLEADDDPFS